MSDLVEERRRVALVTDSTALLTDQVTRSRDIRVVPLQVVLGARSYDEGDPQATPQTIASALAEFTPVSTSRPAPQRFLDAYRAAAEDGAEQVVSVHLSGEVSGTYESALLAARDAPVPVHAVDTRQLGMAVGFAVLAAADALDAGATASEAAESARRRARSTTSLFYVDTLEYLRRGGRIGAAAALLGTALSVKPLLRIEDGRVATVEKVRTAARAISRLEELARRAAEDAEGRPVDVAVGHLANPERADQLAENLRRCLAPHLAEDLGGGVSVGEVGAVIGAHVGPGMVAVVVAPRV
ncbi:MAG TPA: DegV family protein [Nocardioidaceae bacterium]|nr:DegV family protein [Nocardioidaceae bacterium]